MEKEEIIGNFLKNVCVCVYNVGAEKNDSAVKSTFTAILV